MQSDSDSLSKSQVWLLAARPKTLPAAAAPVVVGAALAWRAGQFRWDAALAALLAALLLQIGANLANDVFDYHRGADTHQRLGPLRVTQAGLLTPGQVLAGMWVVFGLAAVLGVYLTWLAGWPVMAIGLASILAAIAYTGGPFPFGYYGLGDLFVFIFFGLVAVCGSFYVHTRSLNWAAFWSALPMGFLITAILVVNNLRDLHNDRAAGKRTLAVRLGEQRTRWQYLACLAGAYLTPLGMAAANPSGLPFVGVGAAGSSLWLLLSWLSLPMGISLVRFVWTTSGKPLNQALAGTGRLTLIYGVLFALGLIVPVLLGG
ncbi:MAG: 1,4-dihydroxy-2-naphthoate polyprenyltransferase [Chloroflexota bacterium]